MLAEFCRIHPIASTTQNLATWIVSNVDGSFRREAARKQDFTALWVGSCCWLHHARLKKTRLGCGFWGMTAGHETSKTRQRHTAKETPPCRLTGVTRARTAEHMEFLPAPLSKEISAGAPAPAWGTILWERCRLTKAQKMRQTKQGGKKWDRRVYRRGRGTLFSNTWKATTKSPEITCSPYLELIQEIGLKLR